MCYCSNCCCCNELNWIFLQLNAPERERFLCCASELRWETCAPYLSDTCFYFSLVLLLFIYFFFKQIWHTSTENAWTGTLKRQIASLLCTGNRRMNNKQTHMQATARKRISHRIVNSLTTCERMKMRLKIRQKLEKHVSKTQKYIYNI